MSEGKAKSQEEIQAKDKPWSFESIEKYYIAGRGKCFVIKCPFTCQDFDWLINREVTIDTEKHKIIGVERFMHAPPWSVGEKISVLVEDFGSL